MPNETERQQRQDKLREINDELIALTKSPLYRYRTDNKYLPVAGEGDCFAKIMFVGEAPGRNEAKTGKPFCGSAGKIFDELLSGIGINRSDVYVTNIVKDRPPENRDPSIEEIECYGPFLDRQIDIIRPIIIATLGRYSMRYVMDRFGLGDVVEPISSAHGKSYETEISYGMVKIIPLYHPAAAIYNQALKDTLKKDFEILK